MFFFSEGPCCCRPTPGSSWDCSMQLDILDTCSVPGKNHLPSRRVWIKKTWNNSCQIMIVTGINYLSWLGWIMIDWHLKPCTLQQLFASYKHPVVGAPFDVMWWGRRLNFGKDPGKIGIPSVGHDSHGILRIRWKRGCEVSISTSCLLNTSGVVLSLQGHCHVWIIHFSHVASYPLVN